MIVGHAFAPTETVLLLTLVLKAAFQAFLKEIFMKSETSIPGH
jgi:hypothetical protein